MTLRRMMIALLAVLPALVAAAPPPGWEPPDPKKYPYRTLTDGDMSFYEVIFSRDGKLVAGGGRDEKIRLWSRETGELVARFGSRTRGVKGRLMAFTGDGKRLVAHTYEMKFSDAGSREVNERTTWYDTSTGRAARTAKGADVFIVADVSPDGKTILAWWHDWLPGVRVVDQHTGRELRRADLGGPGPQAFAAGGSIIAVSGREMHAFDAGTLKGERFFGPRRAVTRIDHLCPSPDGKAVVILFTGPGTRRDDGFTYIGGGMLVEVGTGKELWFSPEGKRASSVAFDRRGRVLPALDNAVAVLDGKTGKRVCSAAVPGEYVDTLAVTADGRWAMTADSRRPGVRVWSVDDWE